MSVAPVSVTPYARCIRPREGAGRHDGGQVALPGADRSDDRTFCERVSQALADGYHLHGGPALTFDGERVIVAQALVLDAGVAVSVQEV